MCIRDRYKVTFGVDTVANLPKYDYGLIYTTNSITVTDKNENTIVYRDSPEKFTGSNLINVDSLGYWTLKTDAPFDTDVFDGLQLNIDMPYETGTFDFANSGWVTGSGILRVVPSIRESSYMPWDYDIIFSSNSTIYTTTTKSKSGFKDALDARISTNQILLIEAFFCSIAEIIKQRLKPNIITYSSLIKAFSDNDCINQVKRFYNQMISEIFKTYVIIYKSIIKSYC